MEDIELGNLFVDIESDRAERKASASDFKKIRKCICAFANDLPNHQVPGVLFIGANDDGSCANLNVTDDLLKKLSEIRSDGTIMPFPSLTVQKKTINGCEIAVIIVDPAYAPPVRFNGRVYIRVGPTTRVATSEEERRLTEKRRAGDLPYDINPILSASLEDLNLDRFKTDYLPSAFPADVLEMNDRSIKQQLASLRFTTPGVDPVPTVLGVLVAGKNPRDFLPGAYIQFLRIEGIHPTDPIKDNKVIDGPLSDLLKRVDDIFKAHVSIATEITSGDMEIRHPDYPVVAFQQLARNAVMHRVYEGTHAPVRITWFYDRIEINNPGGFFGQVSRENFEDPGITDYRNPHLAEAMKNLGYVQRFGVGIQLAKQAMNDNGNPPLEFNIGDANISVTMRRR